MEEHANAMTESEASAATSVTSSAVAALYRSIENGDREVRFAEMCFEDAKDTEAYMRQRVADCQALRAEASQHLSEATERQRVVEERIRTGAAAVAAAEARLLKAQQSPSERGNEELLRRLERELEWAKGQLALSEDGKRSADSVVWTYRQSIELQEASEKLYREMMAEATQHIAVSRARLEARKHEFSQTCDNARRCFVRASRASFCFDDLGRALSVPVDAEAWAIRDDAPPPEGFQPFQWSQAGDSGGFTRPMPKWPSDVAAEYSAFIEQTFPLLGEAGPLPRMRRAAVCAKFDALRLAGVPDAQYGRGRTAIVFKVRQPDRVSLRESRAELLAYAHIVRSRNGGAPFVATLTDLGAHWFILSVTKDGARLLPRGPGSAIPAIRELLQQLSAGPAASGEPSVEKAKGEAHVASRRRGRSPSRGEDGDGDGGGDESGATKRARQETPGDRPGGDCVEIKLDPLEHDPENDADDALTAAGMMAEHECKDGKIKRSCFRSLMHLYESEPSVRHILVLKRTDSDFAPPRSDAGD